MGIGPSSLGPYQIGSWRYSVAYCREYSNSNETYSGQNQQLKGQLDPNLFLLPIVFDSLILYAYTIAKYILEKTT